MILREQPLPVFPGCAKQFFFRLLCESKDVREEHDACDIDVPPICLKSHLKHDARF